MIVSYKNRFIFIHCRKTAGSSISMILSKYLGPMDIQLSALRETLEFGGKVPVRTYTTAAKSGYMAFPFIFSRKKQWRDVFAMCAKKAYQPQLGHKPQHASAAAIAEAFPNEWNAFTKFCVIRNPFTLAVSDYNWRTRHLKKPPSFPDYLKALVAGDALGGLVPVGFHNNWRQYTIEGHLAVDQMIRFENLAEDLGNVLSTIGIPFNGKLPRLKETNRKIKPSLSYSDYYTSEAVELVEEIYREEIDAFGYRFEDIA